MRLQGYYWVKYNGEWTVGQYTLDKVGKWGLPSSFYDNWWVEDSDFEEIDERRIERQPPRPSAEEIARKTEELGISQSMGDRINDVDEVIDLGKTYMKKVELTEDQKKENEEWLGIIKYSCRDTFAEGKGFGPDQP